MWQPSCFACIQLQGSLTLAHKISTFLKLLANFILFKNSGTGSLPVSPALPAGRAGDTGKDPVPEFLKSIKLARSFKNVEILWASVREPYNYIQAKQLGCHIITIPPSIIEKIEKFGKSFDKLTKETVKAFLIDSKKSKFKI